MAERIYAAGASACNRGGATTPRVSRIRPRWRGGSVPNVQFLDSDGDAGALLPSRFDDALFGKLDFAGVMSVDALVRSIPDHPRPLCSILAMIEAGAIAMDCSTAFDGDTQLWCLDTAPRL